MRLSEVFTSISIVMKVPANIKQSEQTPNGIYSLKLLELWDLRLKG